MTTLPDSPISAPRRGRSGTVLASIVFAAMIAAVAYRYWPGDERSIRRHLSNLSESLSLPGSEGDLQKLTRFAALGEYVTEDVRIRVRNREVVTRETVLQVVQRVKPPPGGIAVEFVDLVVTIAEDRQTADVTLTAKVSQTDPVTGEALLDTAPVDLSMVKLRDDWVIARAETSLTR